MIISKYFALLTAFLLVIIILPQGMQFVLGSSRPIPDNANSISPNAQPVGSTILACTPPPPDMINWWPGDGDAKDIIGGNKGRLMNGAGFGVGKVNPAFSFDGVDDFVITRNNVVITNDRLTIDAWVNPYSMNTFRKIVKVHTGAYRDTWLGTDDAGKVEFAIYDDTGRAHVLSYPISVNVWSLVAGTYDGSVQKLYVNGNLVASTTWSGRFLFNDKLYIGRDHSGAHPFYGLIDEVEIFNRALSQAEIQRIMDAGGDGKCRPEQVCEVTPDEQTEAQRVLNAQNIILQNIDSTECDGFSPGALKSVQPVAGGQCAVTCPGFAKREKTSISTTLSRALLAIAGVAPKAPRITWITGGKHQKPSGSHYDGRAFDMGCRLPDDPWPCKRKNANEISNASGNLVRCKLEEFPENPDNNHFHCFHQ